MELNVEGRKHHVIFRKGLTLDKEKMTVWNSDQKIQLTVKEFELLYFLASNAGHVLSKEQIYYRLWKEDISAESNSVETLVMRLRKKLELDPSSFNFERKGQIEVPSEGVDFDDLFEKAGDAGAEDVIDDGDVFTVITDPSDLHTIRKALQDSGFDYDSADMVMRPKNEVSLSLEDAQKVSKLIDNLDDLDDVQNIYANWTASDEVMAQLADEE